MFKNWKTTGAGCIGGLPLIIEGVSNKDWGRALWGLGALLIGIFAKDNDKTGIGF